MKRTIQLWVQRVRATRVSLPDWARDAPHRCRAMTRIAIVGGGPAGYEAALVAVELAAEVLLVERDRAGGQCVLSDCVPSKTFIATGDER